MLQLELFCLSGSNYLPNLLELLLDVTRSHWPTARTPLAASLSVVFLEVSFRNATAGNITQIEAPKQNMF